MRKHLLAIRAGLEANVHMIDAMLTVIDQLEKDINQAQAIEQTGQPRVCATCGGKELLDASVMGDEAETLVCAGENGCGAVVVVGCA